MQKIKNVFFMSLILNIVVEALSQRWLLGGVVSIFTAPYIFMLNMLIIGATLSVSYLFKRRKFMFISISIIWVLFGGIDYILRSFRKTPFTANDFLLINDAIKIAVSYIGIGGVVGIIVVFVAIIICLFFYYFTTEKTKEKINYLVTVISVLLIFSLSIFMTEFGISHNILPKRFGNIITAYEKYGFAYCFVNSIFSNGIKEPSTYDVENFEKVEAVLDTNYGGVEVKEYPNIIFLQLESFMNPELIKDVEFSQPVTPYFNELYEKYPSGYLYVPSFGAGTANTEFEILTGMNLDDFGTGEYPFKTFLKNMTCESIAYNLKTVGYNNHVIHNNDGSFYSRQKVYPNLGFDDFVSIEYMEQYETNPTGWAKDRELIKYINQVLDSTSTHDFIYAISVQGHGDYPVTKEELDMITKDNPLKYNLKANHFFDEEASVSFEYYISQLKEMDDFIKELINKLSLRDENIMLVMYGDHLPGFEFTDEHLLTENIYASQYVVWSNYNTRLGNKDIESFQLGSVILKSVDVKAGIINKFHQKYYGMSDYLEKLTLLEYDLIYGEKKIYDEVVVYPRADMKMGINDILIDKVYMYNDNICVEGCNFNQYSRIVINDKEMDTECINPHTLVTYESRLKQGDKIRVIQSGKDGIELSTTEEYLYSPE